MMGKDEAAVEPHRKSNRLKGYDYSKAGYYFVTMCARDKGNWFGRVECEKTILNEYGKLAREIWCDIPRHYEQVQMDEFTAMPNHIHGIVIINEDVGTEHCSVPTDTRFGLLSKVVKSFKEAFVKALKERSERAGFQWQRSFYRAMTLWLWVWEKKISPGNALLVEAEASCA